MSLKQKLVGSYLFMALIIVVVGGIGFFTQKDIIADYTHVTDINLANILVLGEMSHSIQEGQMLAELAFINKDKTKVKEIIAEINEVIAAFDKNDTIYQSVPFSEGEAEIYNTFGCPRKYRGQTDCSGRFS